MIFLIAALVAAETPAVQPTQASQSQSVEVTAKQKPKQVCKSVMLSGSRMPQRICEDKYGVEGGNTDVRDAADNAGLLHATPGPATGGLGGTPQ